EDMDKFFTDFMPAVSKGFAPAVDIYQDKDNVIVEVPLAGIDPNKVDVSIDNDVLTIKGDMEKKTEIDEKDYYRKEVKRGSFYRAVPLPTHVIGENTKANYHDGILKVQIPKASESKPKSIKVNIT
ncbi:Hsp20/alpha crystallin family protein, partial [Patescibacteria group bacterium]